MKKVLILLIVAILLTSCGSENSELSAFVEKFNQSARKYDAIELIENEFGKIETEDGESWRNLFESKEYSIEIMCDKNNIAGYCIDVVSDKTSISKTGKGYSAVLTLADTLGLNIKELEKGMQAAFNENFYNYEDGSYEVRITVINITHAMMSITIEEK